VIDKADGLVVAPETTERWMANGERRGVNAAGIFDYKLNDNIMTWPAVATWGYFSTLLEYY
jgi:hypothetical protein